jgi:hypothetical protein
MEWIYKKIWELKSKALTVENKARIQKLQQQLDNEQSVAEKGDKINSANISIDSNSSSKEEEEIHRFLFNRYNR